MDNYDKLCERLRKMTQKGKPELGMALLEDFYLQNQLPRDCRYDEWMAHYHVLRLEINQKEGLVFNPETNSNYIAAKSFFDANTDIPIGWEEERQTLIAVFAEVCEKNAAILCQNAI